MQPAQDQAAERAPASSRPPAAVEDHVDCGSAGVVGVTRFAPVSDAGGPLLVLAHGAGTDRHHRLVAGLAVRLAARGTPVVTFNFAYAEAGRRSPDRAEKLDTVYRAVAEATAAHAGRRPLALGGRSMGARVAGRVLASGGLPAAALVLVSYPLHRAVAAGAAPPGGLRTEWWPAVTVPALFVQGDRDRLCDLGLLQQQRSSLGGGSRLVVLSGADHSLAVPRATGRTTDDVLEETAAAIAGFLAARDAGRHAG